MKLPGTHPAKKPLKPSYGPKTKMYPDTQVTVIYAREVGKPQGSREPIDWRLMTNLPIDTLADAVEKLEWYALRWKIEVFLKILKSGCKNEESRVWPSWSPSIASCPGEFSE